MLVGNFSPASHMSEFKCLYPYQTKTKAKSKLEIKNVASALLFVLPNTSSSLVCFLFFSSLSPFFLFFFHTYASLYHNTLSTLYYNTLATPDQNTRCIIHQNTLAASEHTCCIRIHALLFARIQHLKLNQTIFTQLAGTYFCS